MRARNVDSVVDIHKKIIFKDKILFCVKLYSDSKYFRQYFVRDFNIGNYNRKHIQIYCSEVVKYVDKKCY